MTPDTDTIDRLARLETKVDTILTTIQEYNTRFREIERTAINCIQNDRLEKIETRVYGVEDQINAHINETIGHQKGTQFIRDLAMIGAGAVITWLISSGLGRL